MDWSRTLFVDVWPGWAGGALISVAVVTLLLTRNRQLGVSFCYAYVIDRVNDWFEYRAKGPDPAAAAFPIPGAATNPLPQGADAALSENPADFPMPGAFPVPTGSGSTAASAFETSWPLVFLIGILLGGILSGALSRVVSGTPWTPNFDYAGFDKLWKIGPLAKAGVLFGGGILVGFGTRMTGGCTSGHAIMGAPALQKASIVAMCVFMGAGIALSFLLNAIL